MLNARSGGTSPVTTIRRTRYAPLPRTRPHGQRTHPLLAAADLVHGAQDVVLRDEVDVAIVGHRFPDDVAAGAPAPVDPPVSPPSRSKRNCPAISRRADLTSERRGCRWPRRRDGAPRSGSPLSTRSATMRWSLVGTYTRSAASAGAACAGDFRSCDQMSCPSVARSARTSPVARAMISQPLSHTGWAASLSAIGSCQATVPSLEWRGPAWSGSKASRMKTKPSPATGGISGRAATSHCRVPVMVMRS